MPHPRTSLRLQLRFKISLQLLRRLMPDRGLLESRNRSRLQQIHFTICHRPLDILLAIKMSPCPTPEMPQVACRFVSNTSSRTIQRRNIFKPLSSRKQTRRLLRHLVVEHGTIVGRKSHPIRLHRSRHHAFPQSPGGFDQHLFCRSSLRICREQYARCICRHQLLHNHRHRHRFRIDLLLLQIGLQTLTLHTLPTPGYGL